MENEQWRWWWLLNLVHGFEMADAFGGTSGFMVVVEAAVGKIRVQDGDFEIVLNYLYAQRSYICVTRCHPQWFGKRISIWISQIQQQNPYLKNLERWSHIKLHSIEQSKCYIPFMRTRLIFTSSIYYLFISYFIYNAIYIWYDCLCRAAHTHTHTHIDAGDYTFLVLSASLATLSTFL